MLNKNPVAKPATAESDFEMEEEEIVATISATNNTPKKVNANPAVIERYDIEDANKQERSSDSPQETHPFAPPRNEVATPQSDKTSGNVNAENLRFDTEDDNGSYIPTEGSVVNSPTKSANRVIMAEFDKPDYTTFKKRMEKEHARTDYGQKYTRMEALFKFTTGWHYFVGTTVKSDVDKFGIGMVLYFRFLKLLVLFFFIASMLSIPVLYFCVQAATKDSSLSINNYKTGLYATTLGPISAAATECFKANVGDPITFTCQVGTIGVFSTFTYGRIVEPKSMTCDHYSFYSYDTQCNAALTGSSDIETQYANCVGQTTCTITVNSDFFDFTKSGCSPWDASSTSYSSSNLFYFSTLCQNIQMEAISGLPASKNTVGLIVASLDAAIILLYILFLLITKKMEKTAIKQLQGATEPIESHTIEVKSLPKTLTVPELRVKLWEKFSKPVVINKRSINVTVVDVQMAEPNSKLHLDAEIANIKETQVKIYKRLYQKWTSKKKSIHAPEIDIDELRKLAFPEGDPKAGNKKIKVDKKTAAMQAEFKKIEKTQQRLEKLELKLSKMTNEAKSKAISAFITFETHLQRNAVYFAYQRSPLSRFFYSLCCCGYKKDACVFEKKYLKIVNAPAPDDITWANINVSLTEKFIRRFISWALTFVFWVISFALMTYVRNKQAELAESLKPGSYCLKYPDVTQAEAIADKTANPVLGLMDCYCTDQIARVFSDSNCKYLQSKTLTSNSLPFLVVVAVIIINFVLQSIFRLLSVFERHKSATSESVSRIIKIFVAQALNTGAIILIVNIKFHGSNVSSVLGGTYDDVSAAWFTDVATTLLITMLINVVNLPIVTAVQLSIKYLMQLCDRGCKKDRTKTKKQTELAWENLYIGPEFFIEFRYAQILTVIFVCMLYSAGVPMLFISTFAQLFIFYVMDKYYLLRVYRLPRRVNGDLQSMVVNSLFVAIILHCGTAVWMYGNIKIFGDSTPLSLASGVLAKIKESNTPGIFTNLVSRAFQNENLSLGIIFVLSIVYFVVRLLFKNSIRRLFQLCKTKMNKRALEGGNKTKYEKDDGGNHYYARVKRDAIEDDIKLIERDIIRTTNDKLKELLEGRLHKLVNERDSRTEAGKETVLDKFQGIFSYHIGHNPIYKKQFQNKGFDDTFSPNNTNKFAMSPFNNTNKTPTNQVPASPFNNSNKTPTNKTPTNQI